MKELAFKLRITTSELSVIRQSSTQLAFYAQITVRIVKREFVKRLFDR